MISVTKLLFSTEYFGDTLRYSQHSRGARNGVTHGAGPVVVWNSTRTCNLKCRHCYMDSDSQKYQGELSTSEAKKFIDDLAEFKVPVLLFSGGEPLIRADFFELAAYAAGRGIRPTLSTNGTLITLAVARKIKEIGVGYVGISLDGLREINDKFRGKEGAFADAMQGIKNCVAVGQRVGLRFTINRHNLQELDHIFDFIEAENIDRVCFYHLVYSGRGHQMVQEDVTPAESRQAMDTIIRRTRDFEERGLAKEILTVDNHCDGVYLYVKALNENNLPLAEKIKTLISLNGGNRSGIAFAEVDPNGFVHPDQFTQHHTFGNVRERKFADIWTDLSNPILRGLKDRKPLLKGRCAVCKSLDICNGNFRTRAEAMTGDFWESDPACYLTDAEIGIANSK
ncbi:putative heme d1 biosynthesis radical SAM protein NirJ1 [Sporomusa acidovorans]|uniref:Mycofactocin radical SAM maturase MftC n=1 Tax=Sporomusa acidovorans (strain ATCC 49682 / DSM 3132 / Mol) TaxID=1123286 RepID=A0ABZ3J6N6_SPOA4|nr:putative heme d1 biosynthesis radical SAM protein NirJ1 [Sporomusa acidovorans]OZC21005.1 antilisterial bacteriocin subtilosin biosynthesis protein AlbA [Sporomusa acidovorans DSM 3132]SDF18575.1 putative heme d1 biosynthesis radical SAM protein NirJ1 [Sporomusa acidovorans]